VKLRADDCLILLFLIAWADSDRTDQKMQQIWRKANSHKSKRRNSNASRLTMRPEDDLESAAALLALSKGFASDRLNHSDLNWRSHAGAG